MTVEPISKWVSHYKPVVPAKAGIQKGLKILDSRLRGNDNKRPDDEKRDFETGSNQVFKETYSQGVKEENMDKKRELNIEGVAKFVKKVWKTEDHVPMENEQKEAVREVIEQRPHRINTILKGSKLVGNITVAQDLEFSGDVEGNITAEQKSNVVIRGNCKGNITAREGNIELEGDVSNGDIIAGGSVRITGNFRGRKIEAKEKIYINGEFAGTLESSEIELGPNARGKGELIYRDYVSIHRGAHIEAQIHRVGKELGEERKISNTRVIDFESPSQKKSEAK